METLVWLGTWEDPLGPGVGRLGKGCVKSTPLWGEDSHIELWWTLNTDCNPVDIQGQSSYSETGIRSQSGKRFKWKWNQIMSRGVFGQKSPDLSSSPSWCNWPWQSRIGDMQPTGNLQFCHMVNNQKLDLPPKTLHLDHFLKKGICKTPQFQ